MQKELDTIKAKVTAEVYKRFMDIYAGNKSRFAKEAGCDEKMIRLLFDKQQGMTLNLLFKLAYALHTTPSELLQGLYLKKKD